MKLIRLCQFPPYWLIFISAGISVISYLQALNFPFISDDVLYITSNKELAELRPTELWKLFVKPYNSAFEFLPLRDFSYWIDITLFGQTSPVGFRLHNVFLYLACLPLIYLTTLRLWRYFRPIDEENAPWAAAAITALFAIHPSLVESVVWIGSRKYLLANLFSMLALFLAIHVKQQQRFSSYYAILTLISVVAVMLSKSSYVAVAPVISILWLIFLLDTPATQRHRLLFMWPVAVLLLSGFLLLVFITHNKGADTVPLYFGMEAISRSLAILGGLTHATLSPESRHFFYPVFDNPWFSVMVMTGVAVLFASVWGLITLLRKRTLAGFALATFLLLCMPYLQLIPAKPLSLIADRYIALAILPAIILLVTLVWYLKPIVRTIILFAIALPWAYQTVERPRAWNKFETLAAIDQRAYPGYYMPAYYVFSNTQLRYGLYREASETVAHISSPEIREVLLNLIQADYARQTTSPHEAMNLLLTMGRRLETAPAQTKWDTPMLALWEKFKFLLREEWKALIRVYPDDALLLYNAGISLLHLSFYQDASILLGIAIPAQQFPDSLRATAYLNFGLALLKTDRLAEAEDSLNAVLKQYPSNVQAQCLLSEVYKKTNRFKEAEKTSPHCPDDQTSSEAK